MILNASGWHSILWFWDLVNLSVQVPLSLSCLQTLVNIKDLKKDTELVFASFKKNYDNNIAPATISSLAKLIFCYQLSKDALTQH